MKTLMDSRNLDLRKDLRKTLRAKRKALTPSQQQQAAQQLVQRLRSHPVFLRSQHISFYMADDGEMNLRLLMQAVVAMGKQCYLPVLHPLKEGELWFSAYCEGDVLVKNRFGLEEPPVDKKHFPAWALDLVLMPLVGFDRLGNRLGMGGGFYDRTFAFVKNTSRPKVPVLMGIAHSCQEVESLKSESWDVTLDYIATDREVIQI
jgi:5-formyltetrahydrofolate cyclo-ligase